jgi:uncharacterized protein (TIGR02678 family)
VTTPPPGPPRRSWAPEGGAEAAAALRLLARQPWLLAGRDDEAITAVRENMTAIEGTLARLGWSLAAERDTIRLRKSPPPRRSGWESQAPPPLACTWFFLLVAAAEAMPPAAPLGKLVAEAKSAAAEAGIPVTGDIAERRAVITALRLLDDRGVIEQVDGDVHGYLHDDDPPVLVAVRHARLLHVIANPGAADPAADPAGWLRQAEAEPDPARRMRRRLVDDTAVHAADLDDAEADWLSRRARDDGAPLAAAFGLHLERRSEGAALVVPDDAFRYPRELGPGAFPAPGTVPHAALLLCGRAQSAGTPVPGLPGWRELTAEAVLGCVAGLAAGHEQWSADLRADPPRLAGEVQALLGGLGLLRVTEGDPPAWRFSPVTARWAAVPEPPPAARSRHGRR